MTRGPGTRGLRREPPAPLPQLAEITDRLRLLADPSRVRLLALVAREELTVAELTAATRLSQSRVSSHLGRLREAGFVKVRSAGTAAFYAFGDGALDGPSLALWDLVRGSVDDVVLAEDARRLAEARASRDGNWADSVAGRMERHYSPGRTWEAAARALAGCGRCGRVLDIASGDGALAELISPRAESVTCLDLGANVVAAGAARAAAGARRPPHAGRLRFVRGDMHALPLPDAAFDQVLLVNSLSYAREPARVLAEAARVLVPDGDLVVTVLARHAHAAEAERWDHVQLGFTPPQLAKLVARAGFTVDFCETTSRERRPPHFEVVTLYARRAAALPPKPGARGARRGDRR